MTAYQITRVLLVLIGFAISPAMAQSSRSDSLLHALLPVPHAIWDTALVRSLGCDRPDSVSAWRQRLTNAGNPATVVPEPGWDSCMLLAVHGFPAQVTRHASMYDLPLQTWQYHEYFPERWHWITLRQVADSIARKHDRTQAWLVVDVTW